MTNGVVTAREAPAIGKSAKFSRLAGLVYDDMSAGATEQNSSKFASFLATLTSRQYVDLDANDRGAIYHNGARNFPLANSIRSSGGPQLHLINTTAQRVQGGPGNGALILAASAFGLTIENLITRKLRSEAYRVLSYSRVSNVLTVQLDPIGSPAPWAVGEALQMDYTPDNFRSNYAAGGSAGTTGVVLSIDATGYVVTIQQGALPDTSWAASADYQVARVQRRANFLVFTLSAGTSHVVRPGWVMGITGGAINSKITAMATVAVEAVSPANSYIRVASVAGITINSHVYAPGGVFAPDTTVRDIVSPYVYLSKAPLAGAATGLVVQFEQQSMELQQREVARVDGAEISFRDPGPDDTGVLVGNVYLTATAGQTWAQLQASRTACAEQFNSNGVLDYGSVQTTWERVEARGIGWILSNTAQHSLLRAGSRDTTADGLRFVGSTSRLTVIDGYSVNCGDDACSVIGGEGKGRAAENVNVIRFSARRGRGRGVAFAGVANGQIVDGTFQHLENAGVYTESGGYWNTAPGQGLTLARNRIVGCGSTWTANGGQAGGIGIYGAGVNVEVLDNQISSAHFHGIYVYNAGQVHIARNVIDWVVANNIADSSQPGMGIAIDGTVGGTTEGDVSLYRNTVRDTGGNGLYISATVKGRVVQDDNTVMDVGRKISATTRRGADFSGFLGELEFGSFTHVYQRYAINRSVLLNATASVQSRIRSFGRQKGLWCTPQGGGVARPAVTGGRLLDGQGEVELVGTISNWDFNTNGDQQFVLTDRARRNGFVPMYLTRYIGAAQCWPTLPLTKEFRESNGGTLLFTTQLGTGRSNIMRQPNAAGGTSGGFSSETIGRPPMVRKPTILAGSSVLQFDWKNRCDEIVVGMEIAATTGLPASIFVAGVDRDNQRVAMTLNTTNAYCSGSIAGGSTSLSITSANGGSGTAIAVGNAVLADGIPPDTLVTAVTNAGVSPCTVTLSNPALYDAAYSPGDKILTFYVPQYAANGSTATGTTNLTAGSNSFTATGFGTIAVGMTAVSLGAGAANNLPFGAKVVAVTNGGVSPCVVTLSAPAINSVAISAGQLTFYTAIAQQDVTFSGFTPNPAITQAAPVRSAICTTVSGGLGSVGGSGQNLSLYGIVCATPKRQRAVPTVAGVQPYTTASSAIDASIYDEVEIAVGASYTHAATTGTVFDGDRLKIHWTSSGAFTVTFDASFKLAGGATTLVLANGGFATMEFERRGASWRQVSSTGPLT